MKERNIIERVRKYGQEEAKRIIGNDLPSNFIDQFLEGRSLFMSMIEKTIEFTKEELECMNKTKGVTENKK